MFDFAFGGGFDFFAESNGREQIRFLNAKRKINALGGTIPELRKSRESSFWGKKEKY
jgi:hypothetical protein